MGTCEPAASRTLQHVSAVLPPSAGRPALRSKCSSLRGRSPRRQLGRSLPPREPPLAVGMWGEGRELLLCFWGDKLCL